MRRSLGRETRKQGEVSCERGERDAPHLAHPRKWLGLLECKPCWCLSNWGKLLILTLAVCFLWIALHTVYPFLAVTSRVETKILVVEGWVSPYAALVGANEFKAGSYERLFTTGGPVAGSGGYINDYNTSASVGADQVRLAGVPGDLVQMVPSRVMDRDRTYGAALALHDWFRDKNMRVHSINVVTEDAHARRTRLLFQKAFGGDVEVGIISVPNPDYDATHWWRYSQGVREVVGETIAYLYARFLFSPN